MPRALVVVIVAVWFVLIAFFVELSPFQSPWPQQRYRIEGAEFAAFSGAQADGSALAVETADDNDGALLVRSVDIADAAQWPVLRYRFAELAPTLELALVYRRADSPGDWNGDSSTKKAISTNQTATMTTRSARGIRPPARPADPAPAA